MLFFIIINYEMIVKLIDRNLYTLYRSQLIIINYKNKEKIQ